MSYTVYTGYLDEDYLATAYLGGTDLYSFGIQFNAVIQGYSKRLGSQFESKPGYGSYTGVEFRSDKSLFHKVDTDYYGYLSGPYLGASYLAAAYDVSFGVQFRGITTQRHELGVQFRAKINAFRTLPVQFLGKINASHTLPIQFNSVSVRPYGIQFFGVLYNTDNLRILANFASRGITGQNWTASNTKPGHFNINNVNTDIVEEIWRTNDGVKSAILTCDTQIPQGIYLDTLAFLNHNLSTSAVVQLIGSNEPTFSQAGFSTYLHIGADLNYYYIAPEYPAQSFRYWRITITDNSNAYGFLAIGTIVFGNAIIFLGECFVDEVDYVLQDFTDTVKTAGFTNVSNSRAIKKKLGLEFRFLNYQKVNFAAMRQLFLQKRTVLKCLWIPTPSPFDQDLNARFALFGKLTSIPTERHKAVGPNADYVSFDIEIDESL